MLEKLSTRERYLLAVLLGVILLAVIYFGFYKYLYPQYRQVTEELHLKRENLDEINRRINQINDLEMTNKELKTKVQNLTDSFNKEVRNGINYYYVGKHALENSVVISELIPQPYQEHGQFLEIPLQVTIRGKYQNVLKFIEQVEKDMPNASEITLLDLHPAGGEKQTDLSMEETEEKKVESKSKEPVHLSEKDPDVEAKITMVTYAVKSPEIMEITQQQALGRWDAFSPTVDIPVAEPGLPEEDAGEDYLPGESGSGDLGKVFETSGGTGDVPESDEAEGKKETGPVPEIIITETGNYSFPERQ